MVRDGPGHPCPYHISGSVPPWWSRGSPLSLLNQRLPLCPWSTVVVIGIPCLHRISSSVRPVHGGHGHLCLHQISGFVCPWSSMVAATVPVFYTGSVSLLCPSQSQPCSMLFAVTVGRRGRRPSLYNKLTSVAFSRTSG